MKRPVNLLAFLVASVVVAGTLMAQIKPSFVGTGTSNPAKSN